MLRGEPGDASTTADRHWRNEMIARLETAVGSRSNLLYVITGAFAMGLHGYSRTTAGIDVVLRPETYPEFTYSLRTTGLRVVSIEPTQSHVTLPGDTSTSRRLTLYRRGPDTPVEFDAIDAALLIPCRKDGTPLRVISLDWLAASKVVALAITKDVRHAADLQSMLARKLVDPDHVRQLLVPRDPMQFLATGYAQLLEKFSVFRNSCWPQKPKPRPKKH